MYIEFDMFGYCRGREKTLPESVSFQSCSLFAQVQLFLFSYLEELYI